MSKILILGAGFAGCTVADLLTAKGYRVTVIEGQAVPGGGCRANYYGGHPYTMGPRIFYTGDEAVIRQMESKVKIRHFVVRTYTYVAADRKLYHYPIFAGDIADMPDRDKIEKELKTRQGKTPRWDNFENYWLDAIGPTLYEKFVRKYSLKMWGIKSNRVLSAKFEWVGRGTPIRESDTRLYGDTYQGYPANHDGYNPYFEQALANSEVHYNCRIEGFDPATMTVATSQGKFRGDIIVNTVSVDTLFGYKYGKLQFHGRQFQNVIVPGETAFPPDMTWIHYSGDEPFTRITEFKKITGYRSADTLLGIEIPSRSNRLYPVQTKTQLKKFARYKELFPDKLYSIGRLGRFQYQGIPDSIRDGIDVAKAITS